MTKNEIEHPPFEYDIVEKRIPQDDGVVNIPPNARGVNVVVDDDYYIVIYLSPTIDSLNYDIEVDGGPNAAYRSRVRDLIEKHKDTLDQLDDRDDNYEEKI